MARSELVELRLTVELLEIKLDYYQSGQTPGIAEALAWANAFSIRYRRQYQLSRVCRVWQISRATAYRHCIEFRHRKPRSAWTDDELVRRLREIIDLSPFPAERYRKLWHRLRLQGIKVSKERIRKLIKANELLPAYGTILAKQLNELWGIDSAKVATTERVVVSILFAVEHCSGECLAIDVVPEETTATWLSVIRQAIVYSFGQCSPGIASGLKIRCDNLRLFRSKPFCDPLAELGIRTSYISPQNPRGNGLAERFVRTLRENRLSVRYFESIQEVTREMVLFRTLYNEQYILQRWGYRTPQQVRNLFRAH